MSSDLSYKCHLDGQSLERARKELNEVEKERDGAVKTLRDWVNQQSWLKSPTDFNFLLRFLRVRKFSQLGARQTLENFWTHRTKTAEWFDGISSDNTDFLDLINTGFFFILPEPDRDGRRIIVSRPGVLNLKAIKKKHDSLDFVFKSYFCLLDWLCMDERMQVNGLIILTDLSGSDEDIARLYSVNVCRKMIPLYMKAYPMRPKVYSLYNMNILVEAIVKIARSTLMTDKMSKRIKIHGKSLVSVYDVIEKRHLPREYLPDDYDGACAGTIADVVGGMKKELTSPEVIAHIKDLHSGRYSVNLTERQKQQDVPSESFRKLNVD